jgi:prepilin-type N-terminal cleavage/methylation domain-containing protein
MKRKSFTLIELLVVIAIIGLLSSIILVSFSGTRQKARDAKRYGDLDTIRLALALYHDANSSYPSTGGEWWTVCPTGLDPTARAITGASGYIPNLAPTYVGQLPVDPLGCVGGAYDGYIYRSDGIDYKFATDGTAEIGKFCLPGQIYDDLRRREVFCTIYSSGGSEW